MFDVYMFDPNQNNLLPQAIGLVGAVIGGLLAYYGSKNAYKHQLKIERKNIAKAIDIDLDTISESVYFGVFYKNYKKGNTKIPEKIDQKYIDEKTTLYSVFNHDIAKLDYDISSRIYEFYTDLFTAESYRIFIINNKDSNDEKTKAEVEIIDVIMKKWIVKCGDNIPKIREKLKEVYES